jgi:hypothetical protein
METILQLMKRNAVPSSVMRTASKGALPIPADQMLEALVYLTSNPIFAQDAKMTLARWDLQAASKIAADPGAPAEVLSYYWAPQNRRWALMPLLIENPAIPETLVMELAAEAPREILTILLPSPRVRASKAIIEALQANPRVTPEDLQSLAGEPASTETVDPEPATTIDAEAAHDPETEAAQQAFQREHAAEIQAEEAKVFQLVEGDMPGQGSSLDGAVPGSDSAPESDPVPTLSSSTAPAPAEKKKLTLLQKIGRLTASERVKVAFTGSREERAVLIRDGARIVQNAVLSSPRLTEPEVEVFSAAKNVHDNVLREIARSRRFMKNYSVVRNLVMNPKTPLDIAMPLVKMLMVFDLKQLQRSRNVSETIRQLAMKYYREKALSGGRTKE